MNGSVFYGTSMAFRLGLADAFAKYIYMYVRGVDGSPNF
jgi:hypothetical protein